MILNDYQTQALTTAIPSGDELKDTMHWVLGITGEAGEVAEKLKKIIRDKGGQITQTDKEELAKEIGDVLWYLAVLSHHLGFEFNHIGEQNIAKLKSRKARDALGGSGDNR